MKELLERLQDDFEYQLQRCLQEDTKRKHISARDV